MHGLKRVQEKHVDDTLERDTRPKGEKQSGLTMSEQRCALVLLYEKHLFKNILIINHYL
jgi:hypothetical protein